jgi:adenylate kinase
MNEKKLIIFFGPPGSGKGTLAQKCNINYGWKHVSTGNLCRYYADFEDDFGRFIKDSINNGKLVDDLVMTRMVSQYIDDFFDKLEDKILLLDGFPRTKIQFVNFINELNIKNKVNFVYFVLFDVKDEILIDRLINRKVCSNKKCEKIYNLKEKINFSCLDCGSNIIKREDDFEDSIRKRILIYNNTKNEIIDCINQYSIKNILLEANGTKDEVFKNYVDKIKLFTGIA